MPATPEEAELIADLKAALSTLPRPNTLRKKLAKCRAHITDLETRIGQLARGNQPTGEELELQLRELLRQKDEACAQEEELIEQRGQLQVLYVALDELVFKMVDRERGTRVITFFDLGAALRESEE